MKASKLTTLVAGTALAATLTASEAHAIGPWAAAGIGLGVGVVAAPLVLAITAPIFGLLAAPFGGYHTMGVGMAAAPGVTGTVAPGVAGYSTGMPATASYISTGSADACAVRYRSYDPATGTFLGHDGLRHPCRL